MTRAIRIAEALSLPLDCVTQTFGVLAKRRAGKSYLAARFVEELWAAQQQVVMLDPKGDSWGLRSSADGKHEGIPILILGGEHGDVRLEPSSGEVVSRMIVEERVSAILDLSEFRKHEVATFCTAFLETLYRLKAKEQFRTAMMLVVDEADAIAPQRPQRGEERMLGAIEDVVRRGGQRGIGCFMATQRAAVINKNILTQVQILVALRTIAPQDLAAMEAWIDVHGTPAEREELMASLPSLPTGTAWFWSPGWPTEKGIFACVKVSPRTTFDSGATPKPGETRVAPKTVADVDLGAVQKRMAATIEKAKADDPRELRRRIGELEKQVKAKAPTIVEKVQREKRVEVPFIPQKQLAAIERIGKSLAATARVYSETSAGLVRVSEDLLRLAAANVVKAAPSNILPPGQFSSGLGPRPIPRHLEAHPLHGPVATSRADAERQGKLVAPSNGAWTLEEADRRILTVLAQYPQGRTRPQVLVLARYSDTGTFRQALARLRAHSLITADPFRITDLGLAALGNKWEPLPTGPALADYWLAKLTEAQARVLRVLLERYPSRINRPDLLTATEYSDTGTFRQALAFLKRVELMRGTRDGFAASEELFQ